MTDTIPKLNNRVHLLHHQRCFHQIIQLLGQENLTLEQILPQLDNYLCSILECEDPQAPVSTDNYNDLCPSSLPLTPEQHQEQTQQFFAQPPPPSPTAQLFPIVPVALCPTNPLLGGFDSHSGELLMQPIFHMALAQNLTLLTSYFLDPIPGNQTYDERIIAADQIINNLGNIDLVLLDDFQKSSSFLDTIQAAILYRILLTKSTHHQRVFCGDFSQIGPQTAMFMNIYKSFVLSTLLAFHTTLPFYFTLLNSEHLLCEALSDIDFGRIVNKVYESARAHLGNGDNVALFVAMEHYLHHLYKTINNTSEIPAFFEAIMINSTPTLMTYGSIRIIKHFVDHHQEAFNKAQFWSEGFARVVLPAILKQPRNVASFYIALSRFQELFIENTIEYGKSLKTGGSLPPNNFALLLGDPKPLQTADLTNTLANWSKCQVFDLLEQVVHHIPGRFDGFSWDGYFDRVLVSAAPVAPATWDSVFEKNNKINPYLASFSFLLNNLPQSALSTLSTSVLKTRTGSSSNFPIKGWFSQNKMIPSKSSDLIAHNSCPVIFLLISLPYYGLHLLKELFKHREQCPISLFATLSTGGTGKAKSEIENAHRTIAFIQSLTPIQYVILFRLFGSLDSSEDYVFERVKCEEDQEVNIIEVMIDYYIDSLVDGTVDSIHYPSHTSLLPIPVQRTIPKKASKNKMATKNTDEEKNEQAGKRRQQHLKKKHNSPPKTQFSTTLLP